jgi:sugar phosphate isomerase/epimerase
MQITLSLFPKFYKHLDAHQLAGLVREVGLDTTNVVVRDGYWTSLENLATELPEFIKAMREEGLKVTFATAGFSVTDILKDPTPVGILAENGIKDFRLDYFRETEKGASASMKAARAQMEQLVPICERYGIRAVYQVHHGTLIPSATAAWYLIDGLPARWVGIELDPGNQAFEGYEDWGRSARLLGDHLVAAGVKDTVVSRDRLKAGGQNKGWQRSWAPIYEGVTNWHDLVRACASVEFNGTFVFMPFYHSDDPKKITQILKREVAYLRAVAAEMRKETK